MLVLGIDPGTASTGFGLVCEKEGTLVAVEYGVITTPSDAPLSQRLLDLHNELCQLILRHQPNSAAVEQIFFARNAKTALAVGQARGVVLLTLAERAVPVFEYTPLEVKQALTGYGAADKAQIQHMTRALLGLETLPRPDDAADALALAICHLHQARLKALYG